MGSYYCSKCGTDWPPNDEHKSCPDCGQYTFHSTTGQPDGTVVEHGAVGTQTTDAHGWRVERYLELGFTEVDAYLLASTTEEEQDSKGRTWTRALNWQRVAAALSAGCSTELAVAIFRA